MATILDRWVPSRRLERKRQQAGQEKLDARFGDMHITAPTEGAWNQIGGNVNKDHLLGTAASGGRVPEAEKPLPESRLPIEKSVEEGLLQEEPRKHNFSITIPLPWSSRKSHTRTPSAANIAPMSSSRKGDQPELSPRSLMSSPEPTPRSWVSSPDPNSDSSFSSPNTTLQSQTTSPVAIYKPVSEEYKQQLSEMASGINGVDSPPFSPPDTAQNTLPASVTYRPASEDFVKELAGIGMGPSPAAAQRENFSRPRAPSKSTLTGLPTDSRPTPLSLSSEPRIASTTLSPYPRPTFMTRSPEPPLFRMGLPAQPRVGSTRSTSRDPASGTARSSSRGPAAERTGTTQSTSRKPTSDRLPTSCSASRGPQPQRSGNASNGLSSSNGPAFTRVPYRGSVSSESSVGSSVNASSNPTSNATLTNVTTTSKNVLPARTESHHDGSVGSAAGYHSAATKEYRKVASDVGAREDEKRRKMEMRSSKKTKKRVKARQGPQEMVPDADELW